MSLKRLVLNATCLFLFVGEISSLEETVSAPCYRGS